MPPKGSHKRISYSENRGPNYGRTCKSIVDTLAIEADGGRDAQEIVKSIIQNAMQKFHEDNGLSFLDSDTEFRKTTWRKKKELAIKTDVFTDPVFATAIAKIDGPDRNVQIEEIIKTVAVLWAWYKGTARISARNQEQQRLRESRKKNKSSPHGKKQHSSPLPRFPGLDTFVEQPDHIENIAAQDVAPPTRTNEVRFVFINRLEDTDDPTAYTNVDHAITLHSIRTPDDDTSIDLNALIATIQRTSLIYEPVEDVMIFPGCHGLPACLIDSGDLLSKLWKVARETHHQPVERIAVVNWYNARILVERLNILNGFPTQEGARDAIRAIREEQHNV